MQPLENKEDTRPRSSSKGGAPPPQKKNQLSGESDSSPLEYATSPRPPPSPPPATAPPALPPLATHPALEPALEPVPVLPECLDLPCFFFFFFLLDNEDEEDLLLLGFLIPSFPPPSPLSASSGPSPPSAPPSPSPFPSPRPFLEACFFLFPEEVGVASPETASFLLLSPVSSGGDASEREVFLRSFIPARGGRGVAGFRFSPAAAGLCSDLDLARRPDANGELSLDVDAEGSKGFC